MLKIVIMFMTLLFKTICLAEDLKIYTENSPPLNYINKLGKLDGFSVAIVEEIKRRLKLTMPIEVVPWEEGYKHAIRRSNTLIFSTTRTPERENLFRWIGPLTSTYWVLVKNKLGKFKINSLEDAKKLSRIGVYKSDAREQTLAAAGFKNLISSMDDKDNLLKLVKNKIDGWFTGEDILIYHLETENVSANQVEIAFVYQKEDLYLAFSKTTDDSIIEQWQKAFEELRKDGTYNVLAKKHLRLLRTGRSL